MNDFCDSRKRNERSGSKGSNNEASAVACKEEEREAETWGAAVKEKLTPR
jgi:hypothetical protein